MSSLYTGNPAGGARSPAIQLTEPADLDALNAASVNALALSKLADYVAWLQAHAAVLDQANSFTGNQSFSAAIAQAILKTAAGGLTVGTAVGGGDLTLSANGTTLLSLLAAGGLDTGSNMAFSAAVAQTLLKTAAGGLTVGTAAGGGDLTLSANGTALLKLLAAGKLDAQAKILGNLATPAAAADAATKAYVDDRSWLYKELTADAVINTSYAFITDLDINVPAANYANGSLIEFEYVFFGVADSNGRGLFLSGSATANFSTQDSRVNWWDWSAGEKVGEGLYFSSAPGSAQASNLSGVRPGFVRNRGVLKTGAVSGAVAASPQLKTSAGTFTVQKGSYVRYRVFAAP